MKPIRSECIDPDSCAGYFWTVKIFPDGQRVMKMHPCTCTLAQQAAQLKTILPVGIRAKIFKSFQIRDSNSKAFEAARQFAQNPWEQVRPWLVFIGANRCGKTHLASAIVNELLDRGEPAYFEEVPSLLDWLRAGYDAQGNDDFDNRLARVKDAPILALDDLGAENQGRQASVTWAQDKLYQIINHRLEHRLPTVFTTNLVRDMLPPRIATRLWEQRFAAVVALS